MCFWWVQGTSVADLFTILLLNTGRLYQVKCFTHLITAPLIKLRLTWRALEEICLCGFSPDIKDILKVSQDTRRLVKECSQQLYSKQGSSTVGETNKLWCPHT